MLRVRHIASLVALVFCSACDRPNDQSTTEAPPRQPPATQTTTASATSVRGMMIDGGDAPWRPQHAAHLAFAAASSSASASASVAVVAPGPPVGLAVWHPTEPRLALARGKTLSIVHVGRPGERVTLGPAAGPIGAIAWASRAPLIATASTHIQLWSTAGGEPLQTFAAEDVRTIVLSHDGRYVAIDDGPRVWKVADGQPLPPLDEPAQLGLWDLSFVADNRHLAAVDPGGMLVWDVSSGERVHEKMFQTGATSPLVVSADGAFIAVAEEMHRLLAYRLSTTKVTHLETVDDCADHLVRPSFAKNSRTLRVQSLTGWWRCWNVPTLSPRSSYKPASPSEESWMSDDCATVVVARGDGTTIAWDAFKSRQRYVLDGPFRGGDLQFSSDSRYVALVGDPLAVWDLNDGKRLGL